MAQERHAEAHKGRGRGHYDRIGSPAAQTTQKVRCSY